MEAARVDALVVHYLTPELTAEACAAVAGPGVEVLVWDNSGDCPRPPGARVFGDGQNRYFAAANNALYVEGSAPLVLLLNPDVVLHHETLSAMVGLLDAHPECWGVTPRLVGTDGADQNYLHGLPTLGGLLADRLPPLRKAFRSSFRRYRSLDQDLSASGPVEQPPAAALLLRRADVDRVGGLFDETYPLFFNDVDLARRMAPLGRCWYAADLAATHVGGASLRAAGRRREPVGTMYDQALLTYAGRHLPQHRLVRLAVVVRRAIDRVRGGWWR